MDFKCLVRIFSDNSRLIAISSPLTVFASWCLGVSLLVHMYCTSFSLVASPPFSCRLGIVLFAAILSSPGHRYLVTSALFSSPPFSRRLATVFLSPRHCSLRRHSLVAWPLLSCHLSIVLSSPRYCSLVDDQYHTQRIPLAMDSPRRMPACTALTTQMYYIAFQYQ